MTVERANRQHPVAAKIIKGAIWWRNIDWTRGTSQDDTGEFIDDRRQITDDLGTAEAVSSEARSPWPNTTMPTLHVPLIDLDFPAVVLPSSTPGHSHLYIDRPMLWGDLEKLLTVMVEVGLVEPGYLAASQKRKATFLRLPWVRKGRESEAKVWTLEEVQNFLAAPEPPVTIEQQVQHDLERSVVPDPWLDPAGATDPQPF